MSWLTCRRQAVKGSNEPAYPPWMTASFLFFALPLLVAAIATLLIKTPDEI